MARHSAQSCRAMNSRDRPLGLVGMGQTRAVVGKARVLDHVGHADGGIEALGHRLHGGRDRDPAAVARLVDVARAGDVRPAALALRHDARRLVHRRIGADHRMDRLQQRQIDDLALAALDLDLAQRDHGGIGAVEPGHHVGERRRRQHRRAVGKAGLGRVARHALHQRAEARLLGVGPRLPPARDAHDRRGAGCAHAARRAPRPIFSSVPGR